MANIAEVRISRIRLRRATTAITRRFAVAAAVLNLSLTAWTATLPTKGAKAPTLSFTQLLQAPANARTDWPSLRGKVVVLDFWAVWCAPCIAEMPHLSELSASLESRNVQFIAIDDEKPDVVSKFLLKRPIHAWIGLDGDGRVFKAYGVVARPATMVIDPEGRVRAVVDLNKLTASQLSDLAQDKQVTFAEATLRDVKKDEAVMKSVLNAAKGGKGQPEPVFELTIRPGDPKNKPQEMTTHDEDGRMTGYFLKDQPVRAMIAFTRGIPKDRIVAHGAAADKAWSMRLTGADLDMGRLRPIVESALTSGAGLKVTPERVDEDVYVLQPGSRTRELLVPTATDKLSVTSFDPDEHRIVMANGSLDELAVAIEDAIGAPVLNETGIPGHYDGVFEIPANDVADWTNALEGKLGLTVSRTKRKVERTIVDPLPAAPNSAQSKSSEIAPRN